MVRHLVEWNFIDSLSEEERAQARIVIREKLENVAKEVSGVVNLQVMFNELDSSNRDILLFADYDSVEALNAYQIHPAHLDAKEYIGSRTKDRACFDYEI